MGILVPDSLFFNLPFKMETLAIPLLLARLLTLMHSCLIAFKKSAGLSAFRVDIIKFSCRTWPVLVASLRLPWP